MATPYDSIVDPADAEAKGIRLRSLELAIETTKTRAVNEPVDVLDIADKFNRYIQTNDMSL